jgi:hypothetical protein
MERNPLFLILAAGLGADYIPFTLLPRDPQVETGLFAYLAFPLWLLGGMTILWCFWNFTFQGHGTPAPIDPPKELVTTRPDLHARLGGFVLTKMMAALSDLSE